MAEPLNWSDGLGFDIHVLRKGPASPSLLNSFDINPHFPQSQFPLVFVPHFRGAPSAHGISVDTTNGVVKANAHPNPAQPKLRNFLMTVRQSIPASPPDPAQEFETKVRIHVHDSIQKIWLTPASLTVHTHADECQFTVLALFDDGTVGDITDWPQLSYVSSDTSAVNVLPGMGGKLTAEPARPEMEMEVPITVTLKLTTPPTNKTASAKVNTRANWRSLGRQAVVEFIAGPVKPNEKDPSSAKSNSVKSVVQSRTNILFLSEGFTDGQKDHFRNAVETLVKTGLPTNVLEPFKLLKGSINYWRCFVRSQEDGISLLGDHEGSGALRTPLPRPEPPTPGATSWSVATMIHELGLPVPLDPVQSVADWVTHWKKLYTAPVTAALVTANFADWDRLRTRTPLNERDSVFGFARDDRARVSTPRLGDPLLRPALRRPEETRISEFLETLTFGQGLPGGDPFPFGETFIDQNKDTGLVCFVCLSDRGGGEARPIFFAAATGMETRARVAAATDGVDIQTHPLPTSPLFDNDIFASRVAHECSHGFGLGDEYGPGNGTTMHTAFLPFPNLVSKMTLEITPAPPPPQSQLDAAKIKWARVPRTIKIEQVFLVDALGGGDFQMKFAPASKHNFLVGDIVVFRQPPLRRNDPFANHRFRVIQKFGTAVDVRLQTPQSFTPPSGNLSGTLSILVCVNKPGGPELGLVAQRVLAQISQTGTPLNRPTQQNAPCDAASNSQPVMLPRNLPTPPLTFATPPPTHADILGLYEGGGHGDCGVYRPAGRCKMRSGDEKVIPFCQVCRYVIVDRVDALKLRDLDAMYEPFYPS